MNGKVGALVSLVGESGWICTCPGGGLQNSGKEYLNNGTACMSHIRNIIQTWAKKCIACLKFSISLDKFSYFRRRKIHFHFQFH